MTSLIECEKSSLEELASRANALSTEINAAVRLSLKHAIEIGGILTDVKLRVGHGAFGSWLKQNIEFSDRSARRYMQLFDRREELLKMDSVTDLNSAYFLLGVKRELEPAKVAGYRPRPFNDMTAEELSSNFKLWFDQFAGYVTLESEQGKTVEEIAARCNMPLDEVQRVTEPRPPVFFFDAQDEFQEAAHAEHQMSVAKSITLHHAERYERASHYAESEDNKPLAARLKIISEHYHSEHKRMPDSICSIWDGINWKGAFILKCQAWRHAVGIEILPEFNTRQDFICSVVNCA